MQTRDMVLDGIPVTVKWTRYRPEEKATLTYDGQGAHLEDFSVWAGQADITDGLSRAQRRELELQTMQEMAEEYAR